MHVQEVTATSNCNPFCNVSERGFIHRNESLLSLSAQLAPSPLRPRRLFFTPHPAMPTEDSRDTQHQTPREGTSRRKSPGDATLQAEVERLRDSITKMSEKYEHLHCRNAELEHDFRVLKRNQERTRAQDAQQDLTQNVGHTPVVGLKIIFQNLS